MVKNVTEADLREAYAHAGIEYPFDKPHTGPDVHMDFERPDGTKGYAWMDEKDLPPELREGMDDVIAAMKNPGPRIACYESGCKHEK
jgi:hypothetical protein